MALFRNRPLAYALCCFLFVSLVCVKLNVPVKLVFLLLSFAAAFLLTIRVIRKRKCQKEELRLILSLFAVSIASLLSWLFFNVSVGRFTALAEKEITVEGYVCEVKESSMYGSRYGVRLEEIDSKRTDAKIYLEFSYISSMQVGDRFRLTGLVRLPENTDLYHEENALYSEGFVGIITCADYRNCTVFDNPKVTPKHWFFRAQQSLSFRLRRSLDGEVGALASALLLGDKSHLSDDSILAFRRGGVSHLLALSGLHVSMIILLLDWVLKRIFRIAKRYRPIVVLIGLVFYLLLTGCAPSTVRVVVMLGFLYVSFFVGHDYDGFTSLCMVGFLIILFAPYSVLDLSFWLSFVATAGILIFIPVVTEWYKMITEDRDIPKQIRRIIWGSLSVITVGIFANAAILPLSAYLFESTSVLSIVLTIVLSPLVGASLLFSALTLVFPQLTPITFLARIVLQGVLDIVEWCSNLPNVLVLLNGHLTVIILVILTAILVLFAVIELNRKGWLLLPMLLSLVIPMVGYADMLPRDMGIVASYISTGRDEGLVLADGKTAIAVDFSGGSAALSDLLCNTATKLKCTELQELILTHYHSKSTVQIASICAKMKLRTLRLPQPGNESDAAIAARLEQEAILHGVRVVYGTDESIQKDINIVYYHAKPSEHGSESSVLFAMDICGQRVSYANGSIWNGAFSHLVTDAALSADLFIFGAHGGQPTVSSDFFYHLRNTNRVIFGRTETYELCPRDLLAKEYWVEIHEKQFSIKKNARQ